MEKSNDILRIIHIMQFINKIYTYLFLVWPVDTLMFHLGIRQLGSFKHYLTQKNMYLCRYLQSLHNMQILFKKVIHFLTP